MPDSPTLRVQRHRRHVAGDHSLCRAARCQVASSAMTVPAAGEVEGFDRAGELMALAAGLMAAWRRDPSNAVLAREARATLLAIPADAGEDDPLAELRAMMGPS